MVIDERIGAVEDSIRSAAATLTVHEVRLEVLEDQSDRVEALLLEIRDEIRANRGRLDRLTEAVISAIQVIAASLATTLDTVGQRVIVAVLVILAVLLLTALGIDVSGVLPWLGL